MMYKILIILLFFFISCQISEEVTIDAPETTTFRVNVSGLGVEKIPINGRIAAIPSDQQTISFTRPYTQDDGNGLTNWSIMKTYLIDDALDIILDIANKNENWTYQWISTEVQVWTNVEDDLGNLNFEIAYKKLSVDPVNWPNSHVYHGTIYLNGSEQYDVEMSPISYELIFKSIYTTNISKIELELGAWFYSTLYQDPYFNNSSSATERKFTLTLNSSNNFTSNPVKHLGHIMLYKISYYDKSNTKIREYNTPDLILDNITHSYDLDRDMRGKKYLITIPNHDNSISLSSFTFEELDPNVNEIYLHNDFVDPVDGQAYKVVEIGNLLWFANNYNLDTKTSWYYGEVVDTDAEKKIYGKLYTYNEAIMLPPDGWRLPTRQEWLQIKNMSPYYWRLQYYSPNLTIVEGGWRNGPPDNKFVGIDKTARYWTAESVNSINAYFTAITYNSFDILIKEKNNAFSIRFVKDL